MIMNCAIIGSTKIAEVHAKHLINNGIKEITFISRSQNKRKKNISNLKKIFSNQIKFFHSDIKILNKKKFNLICICSKTEIHDSHLKLVSNLKSKIIIEKPIISLLKFKNKYQRFLKNIYEKNKKIIVCYPYIYLAKDFKKYFTITKKLENINFEFQAGGKSIYKKICTNLMPHALSFFHSLFEKNFFKNIININNKLVKKNSWQVNFNFNKIKINLVFRENYKKKTYLKLKVNDLILARKTFKNKVNFINYIENYNTGKKKIIKNPMGSFYKDFFKNLNNTKYYKSNKFLTFELMRINYYFLN